jgi:ABC-type dipeptide/oligopeptide/nickel transport system ATPase component
MIVEVKNLTVQYRAKGGLLTALRKVNFHVKEGEILGIVGESGSGKTTLAMSFLNLLPLDALKEGQIFFKGKDIFLFAEPQLEALRGSRIGMVFQEPAASFNPVLRIGYQFEEFLKEKQKIRSKKKRQDVIFDALGRVRLFERERIVRSYPHQLSGGELQRISLAMAVSAKLALLIADEPTSSLDVTIESQIINLFKELRDTLRLTVVFITHNLDLVKALCDRVLVLYKGEVREIQDKEKLFSAPQDAYTKELLLALRELEE